MSKTRWSTLGLIAILAGLPVLSGCLVLAVGAAGAGGAFYLTGDLKANLDATPKQIIAATKQAFQEMDFTTISASASEVDGKAVARTSADKKVTVIVKFETVKVSKLSIRVGTFGEESLSRMVLEKIKKNL